MYRNSNGRQVDIYDLILTFGGHLKEDNRCGQLRKKINRKMVDEEYRRNFRNKTSG